MDLITRLGAGIKYKTRDGYLFTELRSNLGLLNQTIKGGASSTELNETYSYNDDSVFHLNCMNISVGYTRIFYKPSIRK